VVNRPGVMIIAALLLSLAIRYCRIGASENAQSGAAMNFAHEN
jgi:hypothetical protein